MTTPFPMHGIQPEQGPPLAVPMMFYAAGQLALASAGVLLVAGGTSSVSSRYLPQAQVIAHLGALGFLGATMVGSLYQMIPVLAGAAVPFPRLAVAVLGLLATGLLTLVAGFMSGSPLAFRGAAAGLAGGFVLFLVQTGWALVRTQSHTRPVAGLRLSLLGLAATLALGVTLAVARSGLGTSLPWTEMFVCHVSLGGFVWIGGLIAAVSWQVLPMFYVTPSQPAAVERTVLAAGLAALLTPGVAFAGGVRGFDLAWCFVPAALAVLVVQPVAWIWQIRRRGRRRKDASLTFWWGAALTGPATAAFALAAWRLGDPRASMLFGWCFFVGWAGLLVHGMLTRIIPFLVWFHRFSPHVGRVPVPTMRQLWPDRRAHIGFVVHIATLTLGAAALALRSDALGRLSGVGLIALALILLDGTVHALRTPLQPAAATPAQD